MTFLTACGIIIGNTIKYCILIYHPDSPAANSEWLPTILAMIALASGGVFNVYLAKKFPVLEIIMLFVHLGGWLAVIVTLWVTSPHGNASDVPFSFSNGGGWRNAGIATLVGVLTPWSSLFGYDSSVHMSKLDLLLDELRKEQKLTICTAENAKDASRTIPYSLLTAYTFNSILAFVAGITLIFCLGDADEVLFNPAQVPFIMIFLNSTKSKAGTVVLTVPLILCFFAALINEVATASRQLWAFARDGGLPFSAQLKAVPDAEVPRKAVWTTIAITFVLACINFGPVVGFNAIVSLVGLSLTFSYAITVFCVLWRRMFGKALPRERFSLGAFGPAVNVAALCCVAPVRVLAV